MRSARHDSAGRPRVHVENNPHEDPVYWVTPARLRQAARRFPGLLGRITLSYGRDPAALDHALREAEVLVVSHFPADDLERRAPRLRWIQSTSAGVESLVGRLPPTVTLTNASGVHAP